MRKIYEIAYDIRREWKPVNYAAAPYLDAMCSLETAQDDYGADPGHMIIRYFLGNAQSFRGAAARALKAELKAAIK